MEFSHNNKFHVTRTDNENVTYNIDFTQKKRLSALMTPPTVTNTKSVNYNGHINFKSAGMISLM